MTRTMLALVLLLLTQSHSAPPLHSHELQPSCDTTICRVSDQSLDSALSTFLCFTKEETSAMEEIDKKRELAASIAPYVDGFLEEELVTMGSESLVSLVNLVLHAGSDKVVKKTKRQHLEELVKSMTSAGNRGPKLEFYKDVDPILLGIINCQSTTIDQIQELIMPVAEKADDRVGRGAFFNKLIGENKLRKDNLKEKPEKVSLPEILAMKLPQRLSDKLGLVEKLSVPDAISLFEKMGIDDILDKPQQLSLLDMLTLPNLPGVQSIPEHLHDMLAPEGFALGQGLEALGDISLHDIYDKLGLDNLNLHLPEELTLAHLPEQLSLAHLPEQLKSHLLEELSLDHLEGDHEADNVLISEEQHSTAEVVVSAAGVTTNAQHQQNTFKLWPNI